MTEEYRNQVRLLLSVLPIVARQKDLALKGGTALNFFWHYFPRLSVDIDLTYLPVNNRKKSLTSISKNVQTIADSIEKEIPETSVTQQKSGGAISQAIVGQYPEVHNQLRQSIEVDLSPKNRPEAVDKIDGALGENSLFH